MDKPSGISFVATDPVSHEIDRQNEWNSLPAGSQAAVAPLRTVADARRRPRFELQTDITLTSRTCGVLTGRTVDISESGISVMLPIEAPLGEIMELRFELPCGTVTIHATVRQRNAFRYGFEFVDQEVVHEFVHRTCGDLAVSASL